jgi:nitrite reductase (cytochrome c-552)
MKSGAAILVLACAAENSMGFHAPQELARILGEAIDYARQGQRAAEAASRK